MRSRLLLALLLAFGLNHLSAQVSGNVLSSVYKIQAGDLLGSAFVMTTGGRTYDS